MSICIMMNVINLINKDFIRGKLYEESYFPQGATHW